MHCQPRQGYKLTAVTFELVLNSSLNDCVWVGNNACSSSSVLGPIMKSSCSIIIVIVDDRTCQPINSQQKLVGHFDHAVDLTRYNYYYQSM